MNVAQFMHTDAVSVCNDASLAEAKELMEKNGFGLLLVTSSTNELKGFITKGTLNSVTNWETPVQNICHEARFAVYPEDTLEKAALILLENRLLLLPVVDEDHRLIGVLTQSEILRGLATGFGIGLEGARVTVRVRRNSQDLYKVLRVLGDHAIHLVSVAQGRGDDAYREMILRIQGVENKEILCAALETALREE
jgi:acetoin utilization protein AcuB